MKKYIPLISIIVLAFILRFYKLGEIPLSLYWDETAVGYNAYSLFLTGKDEYGTAFPLLFRSFEDYKMPAYVYLTAIPVGFFGLNEFSVRFVSAFGGVAAVALTYFLTRSLLSHISFISAKNTFLSEKKDYIALLASLLLAISPWHIQFSRTGFEANVALTAMLAGFYYFFRSLTIQKYFPFAFFFFALSFYLYRSMFIFLPVVLVGILFLFRGEFFSLKRRVSTSVTLVLFILVITPITYLVFVGPGRVRADQVSVFRQLHEPLITNAQKQQAAGNTLFSRIIYNRRITYATVAAKNYLSHFSPSFLFFNGDGNGRHTVKGMGVLYRWEIPFILVGLIIVLLQKGKLRSVLLLWLLAAPLAASVSSPSPHALRSLNVLPVPQILTAIGVIFIVFSLQRMYRLVFISLLTLVIAVFFYQYWGAYQFHNSVTASNDWADGYKQLVAEVQKRENHYEKIIISGYNWQPYIYFLFYTKYDPRSFQQSGKKEGFGKYVFGGTAWDKDTGRDELHAVNLREFAKSNNMLVALSPSEYRSHAQSLVKISELKNRKGEIMFILGSMRQ